jgi:hypothetical protein
MNRSPFLASLMIFPLVSVALGQQPISEQQLNIERGMKIDELQHRPWRYYPYDSETRTGLLFDRPNWSHALRPIASGGDKPPKTIKEAIVRALDHAVGRHVFDSPHPGKTERRRMFYDIVQIRAKKLSDGSISVVLSRERSSDTFTEVLAVEFSSEHTTIKPSASTSRTIETVSDEERRLITVLKKVLEKYLTEEKAQIAISVTSEEGNRSTSERRSNIEILVNDLPQVVGHWTMFRVNGRDEIESESRGR